MKFITKDPNELLDEEVHRAGLKRVVAAHEYRSVYTHKVRICCSSQYVVGFINLQTLQIPLFRVFWSKFHLYA